MSMNRLLAMSTAALALVVGVWLLAGRAGDPAPTAPLTAPSPRAQEPAPTIARGDTPPTPPAAAGTASQGDPTSTSGAVPSPHPTGFPSIRSDASPAAAKVHEAYRSGTHPERLSAMILPAPFDPGAWRAAPQAYLDVSEPGRVWQTAKPGPGVPRLRAEGSTRHLVAQGTPVPLRVRTQPNMPVSWNVFDGGIFANGLTAQTVAADDAGVAEVVYTPTTGVTFDVSLLAASPVASGQVRFLVSVQRSEDPAGPVAASP